jgi:hypothetical protein
VRFVRGTEAGFGALTMRCPAGKTLRGLARQGGVGPQDYRNVDYVGKRSVDVIVDYDANRTPVGATVEAPCSRCAADRRARARRTGPDRGTRLPLVALSAVVTRGR